MLDKNEFNLRVSALEFEQSGKMLEWMGMIAKTAFTSLIMINGAAIISLLTFIGNSKFIQTFSNLWFWAIASFCLGLSLVILALAFSFWSQKIFREGLDSDTHLGKDTDHLTKNKIGMAKRNSAISFILLSLLAFVTGCIFSLCALSMSF